MKRKPTNIPDNDTLCAQDMSRATREQQIAHLTQIMENELRRGDDADESLLLECAEHLEQISPESVPAAATVEAHLQAVTAPKATTRHPHCPSRRSVRTALLRIGTVAAVFALVFAMAPQVYAHALMVSEHKATKELIEQAENDFLSAEVMTLSQKAHGELPAATIEPDDFIPEPNYFVKYGSVSDFWNSERLNLLFPKDLTDVVGSIGIAVRETTSLSELYKWTVRCAPTGSSWIYNVSYYQEGKQSSMTWYEKNCEPYTAGDTVFYIEELPANLTDKPWHATCMEGNVRYSVHTEDRATLEMLLQNIVRTSTLPLRESTFTSLVDYEREPGYEAEYHSFEELMAGEDILMIYPKDIPASFGKHTLNIQHTVLEEQGRCWTITCRPDETETDAPIWAYNTFYLEDVNYPSASWYEKQYESYTVGDHIFYIQQFDETQVGGYNWQASCTEGQVRFVILAADYETLKTLMDLTVRAE